MKKQPTLEELIEQCEMTLSEMDTMLMKMKLLTSLIKSMKLKPKKTWTCYPGEMEAENKL